MGKIHKLVFQFQVPEKTNYCPILNLQPQTQNSLGKEVKIDQLLVVEDTLIVTHKI